MSNEQIGQHRGNNLDLLRLLFASLVLVSHAPEIIDGNRHRELLSILTGGAMSFGEFAVDGFFTLSGYLIMTSWVRRPQLGTYLKNRILRIYPGFMVAFCISVLLVGPLGGGGVAYFNQFPIVHFLGALFTLRDPWFVSSFEGQPYAAVNGALWTISYEFTCYVLVPFVGLLASRQLAKAWYLLTVALLIGACFLPELRLLPPVSRYSLDALVRLGALFATGGALALLGFEGLRKRWVVSLVAVLFTLSVFSASFGTVGFAVFGSVLFLSIGLRGPKLWFSRTWPDISYGVYLYGWPIQKLIHWYLPQAGPVTLFFVSLIAALGCGYLSWTFVECWFMRRKIPALPRDIAFDAANEGRRSLA